MAPHPGMGRVPHTFAFFLRMCGVRAPHLQGPIFHHTQPVNIITDTQSAPCNNDLLTVQCRAAPVFPSLFFDNYLR